MDVPDGLEAVDVDFLAEREVDGAMVIKENLGTVQLQLVFFVSELTYESRQFDSGR